MGRPRSQFNYMLVLTFSDVHLKYQKCGRPPYHNSLNIPSDEHCCLLFHCFFVSLRGETSNSHGICHHSKWRTMPPNFGTVETCDVVKTKINDWLGMVTIPPVKLVMTGGWCRWHYPPVLFSGWKLALTSHSTACRACEHWEYSVLMRPPMSGPNSTPAAPGRTDIERKMQGDIIYRYKV